MSEVNNTAANPAQPVTQESKATEAQPQVSLDNISAAEAKALVEEAKAKGIDVHELLAQKNKPAHSNTVPAGSAQKDDVSNAAKEAMKKYKVKVDGVDLEVDEAELLRGYSHQKAANKILQEGKAARKQAEEFISMMKDPQKFYETAKKLGHDPRLLAEQYLVSQLQDEMMDPRDRELRDAKQKLKQIEDMERRQREAIEAQRNEALKAKYAKDYSDQFVAALQETGLPATKPMVAEMAKYISRSAELGFKMTAQEAAQLVKEDILLAHQRLIGDSDGETLLKLLGDEVANKIRKHDTQKVKTPEQYLRTPEIQAEKNTERLKQSSGRMNARQWREFNRKK